MKTLTIEEFNRKIPDFLQGSHFGSLPALVFGAASIIAAFAIFLNPETFAKKLPDTIEAAEEM